jgi:hypothetical protein
MSQDGQSLLSVHHDGSPFKTNQVPSSLVPDTPALGTQQKAMPSPEPNSELATSEPAAQPEYEQGNRSILTPSAQNHAPVVMHLDTQPSLEALRSNHSYRLLNSSLRNALQPGRPELDSRGHVLQLRGLPFNAIAQQIADTFGVLHPIIGGAKVRTLPMQKLAGFANFIRSRLKAIALPAHESAAAIDHVQSLFRRLLYITAVLHLCWIQAVGSTQLALQAIREQLCSSRRQI